MMKMSSVFYRSMPKNANSGSLEKKLDEILLANGEQKNCMLNLEEKGTKTLKLVENFETRMCVLEDKMTCIE